MKLEGKRTTVERLEIEVDPWNVFYALRQRAFTAAGIKYDDAYLSKDGTKIMFEDEIQTSHTSYYEEVLIEKPSKLQLDVVRQFKALQETLQKFDL